MSKIRGRRRGHLRVKLRRRSFGDSEGIVVVDGYCGYNHVCTPEREDISRCETIGDRVRELANPISRLSAGRFYRIVLPDRLYGRVRLDALVSGDE